MKQSTQRTAMIACTVLLIANAAQAADHDRKQVRQRGRIQQGVKSGELTRKEVHRLRLEQNGIRKMERRANADGVMSAGEKRRLKRAQMKASADIQKQKHDAQKAPAAATETPVPSEASPQ